MGSPLGLVVYSVRRPRVSWTPAEVGDSLLLGIVWKKIPDLGESDLG